MKILTIILLIFNSPFTEDKRTSFTNTQLKFVPPLSGCYCQYSFPCITQYRIFWLHLRSIMECATLQYRAVIFKFRKVDQLQNELGEMLCHLLQLLRVHIMKTSWQLYVYKVADITAIFRISCKFRMNRNGFPF